MISKYIFNDTLLNRERCFFFIFLGFLFFSFLFFPHGFFLSSTVSPQTPHFSHLWQSIMMGPLHIIIKLYGTIDYLFIIHNRVHKSKILISLLFYLVQEYLGFVSHYDHTGFVLIQSLRYYLVLVIGQDHIGTYSEIDSVYLYIICTSGTLFF